VGSLVHIAVEVVVSKDGAANRSYADGGTQNAQLFQNFSDQLVNNTMGTTGTVMQLGISQSLGFLVNNCHV
jgi:hypothetical protein